MTLNVKLNVNGQTQVVKFYMKTDIAPKTNTVSFTKRICLYFRGWKVGSSKKDVTQNQESIPELSKPTTKPTQDPKPVTPKMPKSKTNQTPSESQKMLVLKDYHQKNKRWLTL